MGQSMHKMGTTRPMFSSQTAASDREDARLLAVSTTIVVDCVCMRGCDC